LDKAQIYTALGSVVITAVVTLLAVYVANRGNMNRMLLQFKHEKSTRRSEQLRQKLEEVYVLTEKFVTQLSIHWMLYMQVMDGGLTYNQALDIGNDRKVDAPVYDRLEMLVDLYFPELHESFAEIIQHRDAANKILAEHKRNYKAGDFDGNCYVKPMRDILLGVDTAVKRFKESVVLQERKL